MHLYKQFNFNKINLLNLLISAIPLSLILGNLSTNIVLTLIVLVGILNFGKKIFFIKKKIYKYLIYLFFIFLILTTLQNNLKLIDSNQLYKEHIFKSLFYLRFLLLFLIVNKLVEDEKFNTKLFFISCSFFSLIISIDIIIQFFLKKNIIGLPITLEKRPSSFFKEELIAGGFLQKFSIFLIFFLISIKKNITNTNLFFLVMFCICFIPIFLTGNKMPTIIFFMSGILFFLMKKKYKEIIILSLFTLSFVLLIINQPSNSRIKSNVIILIQETKFLVQELPNLVLNNYMNKDYQWRTGYLIHFYSGIQIWKQNKISGNGLKSFRLKCTYENYQTCNTHPHNYLIEILVDTGVVGFLLIYTLFVLGLINFLKFYFSENDKNIKNIAFVFFVLIFFEFFPLRSNGSFFTTNNSIFIFTILPIFLNIDKLKKL